MARTNVMMETTCRLEIDDSLVALKRKNGDRFECHEVTISGTITRERFIHDATNKRLPAMFVDPHTRDLYIACGMVDDMLGRWSSTPTLKVGRRKYQVVDGDLVLSMIEPYERAIPNPRHMERNEAIRKLAEAIIELKPEL